MNILIVGGSGTYGEALQKSSKELDLSVQIISRGVGDAGYYCDLNDIANVRKQIDFIDRLDGDTVVIVNSGILGPVDLASDIELTKTLEAFNINSLSNIPLFQGLYRKGVRKFIVVSSGAALKNYSGWFVYCQTKRLQKAIWESICNDHEEVSVRFIAPGVLSSKMHDFTDGLERGVFPDLDKFFEFRENGGYQDENESANKLFKLITRDNFFERGFKYLDLREID